MQKSKKGQKPPFLCNKSIRSSCLSRAGEKTSLLLLSFSLSRTRALDQIYAQRAIRVRLSVGVEHSARLARTSGAVEGERKLVVERWALGRYVGRRGSEENGGKEGERMRAFPLLLSLSRAILSCDCNCGCGCNDKCLLACLFWAEGERERSLHAAAAVLQGQGLTMPRLFLC